jgi:hypothetical protein
MILQLRSFVRSDPRTVRELQLSIMPNYNHIALRCQAYNNLFGNNIFHRIVIASVAKQSSAKMRVSGLLRYARNDEPYHGLPCLIPAF